MVRPMQKKWTVWLRVIIVTVAIPALVLSALPTPPEPDQDYISTQSIATLPAGAGVVGDVLVQPVPDTNCDTGQTCLLVIIPSNDLALIRPGDSPNHPVVTHYKTSGAGNLPFHPPRILSQV